MYMQDFARAHNLSDTDLSWIYNTKNNLGNDLTAEDRSQRKGAWSVIAQSLPHRTPKSVWAFVTRVLHEGNYLVNHPVLTHVQRSTHILAQLCSTPCLSSRASCSTSM